MTNACREERTKDLCNLEIRKTKQSWWSGPLQEWQLPKPQHSTNVADLSPRAANGIQRSHEVSGHGELDVKGVREGRGIYPAENGSGWWVPSPWVEEWLGWGSEHQSAALVRALMFLLELRHSFFPALTVSALLVLGLSNSDRDYIYAWCSGLQTQTELYQQLVRKNRQGWE